MTGVVPSGTERLAQLLDLIAHLLTALVTKGMTRKEAVMSLTYAGLAPKEVAGMLGLTLNQVSVVLYDAKQAAAKAATAPKKPKTRKG